MKRIRLRPFMLITLAGLSTGACVGPRDKAPVAQFQLEATRRLAAQYAGDLGALRTLATALLDIRAETTRSVIEAAILNRYVRPSGEADTDALRNAIASGADTNGADPLLDEVRAGRFTPEEAAAWLEDFALAWRMHAGVEVRAKLVAGLQPMKEMASARQALLDSLDAHSADVARLASDALASGAALSRAGALEREFLDPSQEALRRFWRDTILADVREPETRRLLESVVSDFAPSLTHASEVSR